MAVYTDISEGDLIAFLAGYDIGELLSYKGIAEGTENSNFSLHTTAGPYFLTLYEKRVEAADLPFFLGLMEHLAGKGISCPLPVRSRAGEMIGHLAGRPCAVITYLEGMWPRRPSVAHCRALGTALAELHLAGADFGLTRANTLSVEGWRTLWDGCRARADEVEEGLSAEIERELDEIGGRWPAGLPEGIIHADLFPDNVFFIGDRLSGLIDFYFACRDHLAYDLATCLNAWCFEKDLSFNLTKASALLGGYASVRRLEPSEIEALPILARGSALRFTLTRLYDWLHGPDGALVQKRDPMDYVRRLRFHRGVTSASAYGLEVASA